MLNFKASVLLALRRYSIDPSLQQRLCTLVLSRYSIDFRFSGGSALVLSRYSIEPSVSVFLKTQTSTQKLKTQTSHRS